MPKSIYGNPRESKATVIDFRPQLDKIVALNIRIGSIMAQIQNSKSMDEKGILMQRITLLREEIMIMLGRTPEPTPASAPLAGTATD